MTAPTFIKTSPPASGVSLTPIDTSILKLVRGGTLPAVGSLLRNGSSFSMIDTRPFRWHQGSAGSPVLLTRDYTALSALPAELSLTRASTASVFNSSGVLSAAAINAARFDYQYNGTIWVPAGLLVEAAGTNLALNSGNIGGANWNQNGSSSIVTNTVVAPDGTTTGSTITFTGAGQYYQPISPSAGAQVMSFFVKSSTAKKFRLKMTDSSGGGGTDHYSSDFTPTSVWQRFSFPLTTIGSFFNFSVADDAASGSGSIDVWGGDFKSAAALSSYIPTPSGATATRSADVLSSNAPLTAYLAAGPSVWEFTDQVTGATSRVAYAAGAFNFPTGKWYRSMGVYPAGTDTTPYMTVGGSY